MNTQMKRLQEQYNEVLHSKEQFHSMLKSAQTENADLNSKIRSQRAVTTKIKKVKNHSHNQINILDYWR